MCRVTLVITFHVSSGCNTIHYILLVNNIQSKLSLTYSINQLGQIWRTNHGTGHMTSVAKITQEIDRKEKLRAVICYRITQGT